jgi:tRNA threonylcarbamoyladenosine biosynthesis protein TsaB
MILAAINTVGEACEIVIGTPERSLATAIEPMTRGHDAYLAPMFAACLAKAELSVHDLDRIAVVTGPGSFTGLRVGIAFAIGLSLPHRSALIGVPSLHAVNEAARLSGADVSGVRQALIPAQKRPPDLTWWTQTFRDGMATDAPAELTEAELLAPQLRLLQPPSALATLHFAARVSEPHDWPARAVYVRPPDAALPAKAIDYMLRPTT